MSRIIVASRSALLICLLFALLLGSAVPSQSQGYSFNYNLAVNSPTFTTAEPVEMGFINVANGNLHIEIPIAAFKQRGGPSYNARLIYDSRIWQVVTGSSQTWQPTNIPSSMGGWRFVTGGESGTVTWSTSLQYCDDPNRTSYNVYTGFTWTDPYGNKRMFNAQTIKDTRSPCDYDHPTDNKSALDASGYHIYITNYTTATIYAPDGTQVYPTVQDSNGNYFSKDGSGNIIDTLGLTPVTVTSGTNTVTYAVLNPQTSRSNFVVTTASQNYNTAFGQSGITESAGSVSAITNLALPDGTAFSFQYDSGTSAGNYAELKSMTLPTGATISFGYTTFSDAYGNANRWINSRTVNGTTVWQYTPSVVISCQSSNCWQKVVVTKPTAESTTYNFFLNNGAWPSSVQYSTTGAGVTTVENTWSACGTCSPTSNIVKQTMTTTISPNPFVSGKDVVKSVQYTYSDPTNGLVSEVDEADFGAPGSLSAGPVLRKTLISYATLTGNNMINRPYQVTIKDGSGNMFAQTTYSYDQTSPIPAGSTPNHNSVSVARGNPTTVTQWVSPSSGSLYKTFSYLDTGLVNSSEENSRPETIHNYYYAACFNSYLSSLTMPNGASRSYLWNCNGGVITQVTDENSQHTTYTYNDPNFWRLTATTDPLLNTTNISYTPTTVESALTFNSGNSTVDVLSTVDNLGRPLLAQRRQAPSSTFFDTVLYTYTYDALGKLQLQTTSLPYPGTAGQPNTSAPVVTTGYNAAGQPIAVSDANGFAISGTYSQNDALVVVGPAPANENPKKRQSEYDGLGRLTSVCEVTTGTGSGTCAQNNAATGYWTKYTYNPLDKLIGVTQNAQAASTLRQTRTYAYDGLGRLTSETNPELGGTTAYTYDSISSGNCSGTSKGDKVKRLDPAGNVSCYVWDGMHRLTSITYPAGPNAASMPGKYYIYDSAVQWGLTLNNPVGRLTEAYTWLNGLTKSIDAFSYDARGQVADFYEGIGHWYRIQQNYFANGMMQTLQGFNGTDTTSPLSDLFTYLPDGEGRPKSMTDATIPAPIWNSTSYNEASQPLMVVPSAGGTESFTYDPNSGRMQTWTSTATAGNKQQVGTLNWNPNGTLQQLVIADTANPLNNQTCNYGYDDLMRLQSAHCGSPWSQDFTYDAWGNINKSGSSNFSSQGNTNNRVPGFTYDGMGNVTNDGTNTYTYDAEGRQITVNTGLALFTTTFDAFNRAFQIQNSSGYTQVIYSASGQKFAFMNGTTLIKYIDPMVAGMAAVHNGDGTGYFQHADWLGSSRWGHDGNGNVIYDRAYAPFGEPYVETATTNRDFTGQTQDTTLGLYDFLFRQQSSAQGRWLVPDPAGLAAVDITNPQTWNRYAYVANNPLSFLDPLGLEIVDCPPGSLSLICVRVSEHQNDDRAQPPAPGKVPEGGGDDQAWFDGWWASRPWPTFWLGPANKGANKGKSCIPPKSLSWDVRAELAVLSWDAKHFGGVRAFGVGAAGAFSPPSLAGGGASVQALWIADYLGQEGLYWSVSGGPTVGKAGFGAVGGIQYMTSTYNSEVIVQDVVDSSLTVGGGAGEGLGVAVDYSPQTGVSSVTFGFGAGGWGGASGMNIASGFIPICPK